MADLGGTAPRGQSLDSDPRLLTWEPMHLTAVLSHTAQGVENYVSRSQMRGAQSPRAILGNWGGPEVFLKESGKRSAFSKEETESLWRGETLDLWTGSPPGSWSLSLLTILPLAIEHGPSGRQMLVAGQL